MAKAPVKAYDIEHFDGNAKEKSRDIVVAEEPLEIRLKFYHNGGFDEKRLAVTMRTPGNDFELAIGFLITEGIISSYADVQKIHYCEAVASEEEEGNVLMINLKEDIILDESIFNRNFYVSSSCGVCGKSSIESVRQSCPTIQQNETTVQVDLIHRIPEISAEAQQVFRHTGGLHAAALISSSGELLLIREDVGRHNAVDKLIGARAIESMDNSDCILFVSGRAGFELVQKCLMGCIPIMVAVGAPSSLAVDMARDGGLTLIGFTRSGRFNVYSGLERISG